jgi:hypothetical protein
MKNLDLKNDNIVKGGLLEGKPVSGDRREGEGVRG